MFQYVNKYESENMNLNMNLHAACQNVDFSNYFLFTSGQTLLETYHGLHVNTAYNTRFIMILVMVMMKPIMMMMMMPMKPIMMMIMMVMLTRQMRAKL